MIDDLLLPTWHCQYSTLTIKWSWCQKFKCNPSQFLMDIINILLNYYSTSCPAPAPAPAPAPTTTAAATTTTATTTTTTATTSSSSSSLFQACHGNNFAG